MTIEMVIQIITATIGSLSFGVLYNVRGKNLFAVAIGGGLAWLLYLVLFNFIGLKNETICYFLVSLVISIYCEIMARVFKAPTTVFIAPSLIPLVPGASLYYTMTSMFSGDIVVFAEKALATLQLAAALAFGVIISSAFTKIINKYFIHKRGV